MRNLKRALSLALATVMTMGMMMVGTGAASAPDVNDDHNVEAIEVIKAAGIMGGVDEEGNFAPDKVLNRYEMAVIMCNLMQVDADEYDGETHFEDIPEDHWAIKYVNACYANKYISGISETEFGGENEIKVVDGTLMIMKALGYFANVEEFEGDYQFATVKQATKIGLQEGLSTKKVDAGLTRNDVAMLLLNALESNMVTFGGTLGMNITLADGTVINSGFRSQYNDETTTNGVYYTGVADDNKVQLIEKLHGNKITKTAVAADATTGVPTYSWKKGTDTVINVVSAADKEVVATEATTIGEILEDLELELVANATTTTNYDGVYVANGDQDAANTLALTTVEAKSVALGGVVSLYTDANGKVNNIIVNTYSIGKISKIVESSSDSYDYLISVVQMDGTTSVGSYKDTQIVGYDANEYAKDDVILYVAGTGEAAGKLVAIAKPATMEGVMEASGTNYIKVNGEKYSYVAGYTVGTDYKNEYTFYLDLNGNVMDKVIVDADAAQSEVNYLYLNDIEIYNPKSGSIKDGADAYGLLKVTFLDGTSEVVDLKVEKATEDIDGTETQTWTSPNWVTGSAGVAIAKDKWYFVNENGMKVALTGTDGSEYNYTASTSDSATAFKPGFYGYTVDDNGLYTLTGITALNADTDRKVTLKFAAIDQDIITLANGKANVDVTVGASATVANDLVDGTANSKTVVTIVNGDDTLTYTGISEFVDAIFEVDTAATETLNTAGAFACDMIVTETDKATSTLTNIYIIGASVTESDNNWAYVTGDNETTADGTAYEYYVNGELVTYVTTASVSKGLYAITITDEEVDGAVNTNVAYATVDAVDETYFVAGGVTYYFDDECVIYGLANELEGAQVDLAKGDVVAIGHDGGATDKTAEVVYVIDAPVVKDIAADTAVGNATTADDTLEFVQNGTEIIVSGDYATNDTLLVTFDGTNWVQVNATAIDQYSNNTVTYTTVGSTTDYADFAGITLTFNTAAAVAGT